jgi:hypothetical protein
LKAYESERLQATANIVRMNRTNPPDAILREVFVRTGDKPNTFGCHREAPPRAPWRPRIASSSAARVRDAVLGGASCFSFATMTTRGFS